MYFWYSRFKNWHSFILLYFLMLHLFEWFMSWIMRFLNKFSYIFWCLWFQLEWNYWNYNSIGYVWQSDFIGFTYFNYCSIGFTSVSHCSIGCTYVSYNLIGFTYVNLQRLSTCVHPLEWFWGLWFSVITGVGQIWYSHKNSQQYLLFIGPYGILIKHYKMFDERSL